MKMDGEGQGPDGLGADDPWMLGVAGVGVVLGSAAVWQDVPPELEARVMSAAGIGQWATPATSRPVVVPRPLLERLTGWMRVPRLAFAAAAVVAVAALGVALLVPTGTDSAHGELSATELASGSHADVAVRDTSSGVQIDLDVTGLPPAPVGQFYAAWVKGPRGLVPIGTFHLRAGTDTVVLWSGVEVADYPTMTVTIQQEGAGTDSSGKVVLRGSLPQPAS